MQMKEELYNLVHLASQKFFGNLSDFNRDFAVPIGRGLQLNSSKLDIQLALVKGRELREKINSIMIYRGVSAILPLLLKRIHSVVILYKSDMQGKMMQDLLKKKEENKKKAAALELTNQFRWLMVHPDLVYTKNPDTREDPAFDENEIHLERHQLHEVPEIERRRRRREQLYWSAQNALFALPKQRQRRGAPVHRRDRAQAAAEGDRRL